MQIQSKYQIQMSLVRMKLAMMSSNAIEFFFLQLHPMRWMLPCNVGKSEVLVCNSFVRIKRDLKFQQI